MSGDNGAMTTLRIATRKSPLALWQSEHVAARLRAAHPGLAVELVPMSTRGDEVLDRSLAAIGGKGLFLKELELAMQRGEADCAVHSLKDVPMELEPGFALSAILERADHADAFVSNRYDGIDALPQGARVGTSSLRRQAQLRARRPDLQLLDLRGNVNTRLAQARCRRIRRDRAGLRGIAAAGLRHPHPRTSRHPGVAAGAGAGRDRDRMPRRRCRHAGTMRGARPCIDPHLRRRRARDEPRAAWQLPRAGGGVRATGWRAPAPRWPGRFGPRRPRGACARTGTRRHARRPRAGSRGETAGAGCARD